VDHLARREVIAGCFICQFVETPDEILEDYTIQQQLNADATARAHCSALANADAGLIQACGELLSHDQKLREAIPAFRSAIQATEAAYTKSHAQIEAAQHEVDNLGQGVG
jgi:hypothetical protein